MMRHIHHAAIGGAFLLLLGCLSSPMFVESEPLAGPPEGESDLADTIRRFMLSADRAELFFACSRADPPGVVLTSRRKIRGLVPGPTLVPKLRCKCKHNASILFWKDSNRVIASICDHCFNIIDNHSVISQTRLASFHMTQDVWARFCRYEARSKVNDK